MELIFGLIWILAELLSALAPLFSSDAQSSGLVKRVVSPSPKPRNLLPEPASFEGVRVLAVRVSQPVESAPARCPVCAESLAGHIRRCTQCGAVHHDECWQYNGRCAVYACASTRAELEMGRREKLG